MPLVWIGYILGISISGQLQGFALQPNFKTIAEDARGAEPRREASAPRPSAPPRSLRLDSERKLKPAPAAGIKAAMNTFTRLTRGQLAVSWCLQMLAAGI